MSDADQVLEKLSQILQAAQVNNQQTAILPTAMMPTMSMGIPQMPQPTGLSVRISIPLPDGSSLPGYLHFGAELASNPGMLPMIAQQLIAAYQGWIKPTWPRQEGGWNRGGYSRPYGDRGWNAGGYGRRY